MRNLSSKLAAIAKKPDFRQNLLFIAGVGADTYGQTDVGSSMNAFSNSKDEMQKNGLNPAIAVIGDERNGIKYEEFKNGLLTFSNQTKGNVSIMLYSHSWYENDRNDIGITLRSKDRIKADHFLKTIKDAFYGRKTDLLISCCDGGSIARKASEILTEGSTIFSFVDTGEMQHDELMRFTEIISQEKLKDFSVLEITKKYMMSSGPSTELFSTMSFAGVGFFKMREILHQKFGKKFTEFEREYVHQQLDDKNNALEIEEIIKKIETANHPYLITIKDYSKAIMVGFMAEMASLNKEKVSAIQLKESSNKLSI